jgi:multidrug efflux pump subunit AcrB
VNVGLKPGAKISLRNLEQNLRQKLAQEFPGTHFSFDPGDLISQTLNFGAPSSAEVAIMGPQYADVQSFANRVQQELLKVGELRDVEFEEPLRYPTVNVHVDRVLAGQLGATANDVGAAVVSATASSRFIAPNYWRDPKSGVSYQVQVQVPQAAMTSLKDIQTIPVHSDTGTHPILSQVADVQSTTVPGELDRQNGMWMIIVSANVGNNDFARAAKEIDRAIASAGQAPRGVTTQVRGQVSALKQIFAQLAVGLALAVVVILLLLTANFQSLRLALIVISTVPAVLVGAILMLLLTGTTLNLESFMGTIMAIGVAVANAILLVTFAEQNRRNGADPIAAARAAAAERLRPVLMTSLAMIAGMVPMALAIGQGSEETAPLGRAVIGGLFAATLATLFLLPTVFGVVQKRASLKSPSLDPEDPASSFAQMPENA